MRYTRTALGLLNAQYRSVLKKCLLINLGLFALGAGVSTANAAVTLSPTLDSLKAEAQKTGAVSEKYDLKKLDANAKVPEGQAAVIIGKNVYHFGPKDGKFGPKDAKLLSILAGTSAGVITSEDGKPKSISFDVSKLPASVFKYETDTKNDHIALNTDNMHTSPNISWEKVGADKKDETGVVAVNLPNKQTEYYKYSYNQPAGRTVYTLSLIHI